MLSRRMILPNEIWKKPCELVLAPGEEKTVEYEPDVKLTAGVMLRGKMVSGKQTVYAASAMVIKEATKDEEKVALNQVSVNRVNASDVR